MSISRRSSNGKLWAILAAGALLLLTGAAQAQPTIAQQVAIPAYFFPGYPGADSADWLTLIGSGPNPTNPTHANTGIVIANVLNGPDYKRNGSSGGDWQNVLSQAHANGIKVLGYVDTGYFNTASGKAHPTRLNQTDSASWRSQIEHDIDAWYAFYGSGTDGGTGSIDGIMLDQGANVCGTGGTDTSYASLYAYITAYIKAKHPGATVVVNPGVAVPQCFQFVADTLLTFEGNYACYTNDTRNCDTAHGNVLYGNGLADQGWANVDPYKIWHIVYATPASQVTSLLSQAKTNNAGYIYLTDNPSTTNPYGGLPSSSFFSSEESGAAAGGTVGAAPSAPTTLDTMSVAYTTASLNWEKSSGPNGVVAYDIYQQEGSQWTKITAVPQPSSASMAQVSLSGLQPNTTYQFQVRARDAAGLQSAPSNTLSFATQPVDIPAPTAPGSLTATTVTYTSVTLSWQASTSEQTIAAYDVYQNGNKVTRVPATATSALVIGLGLDTPSTYNFTVKAVDDEGGTSAASNTVTVTTPTVPAAITNTNAYYDATQATVNYAADYVVPFGFRRVWINSGTPNATCYQPNANNPAPVCADYFIENGGNLMHYSGAQTGNSWKWTDTGVAPKFIPPEPGSSSNTYSWSLPGSTFSTAPTSQHVMFQADGFWPSSETASVAVPSH